MTPHRKRILIIDESPSSLVWQLVLLQEENYDTLTASTLDEGVRIAKLERPSLVVIDAASRPVDAVAAAESLRADHGTLGIPILLIAPAGGLRRGAPRGTPYDAQIRRPLQGSEYLDRIRDLIGARRGGSRH